MLGLVIVHTELTLISLGRRSIPGWSSLSTEKTLAALTAGAFLPSFMILLYTCILVRNRTFVRKSVHFKIQDFKILERLNLEVFKISRFQDLEILKSSIGLNFKIQDFKNLEILKISRFQDFKISRFQDSLNIYNFKIQDFKTSTDAIFNLELP